MKRDLAALIATLVVVTLIAELAGATDLGTSLTFGTIAFSAALLWILVKRP